MQMCRLPCSGIQCQNHGHGTETCFQIMESRYGDFEASTKIRLLKKDSVDSIGNSLHTFRDESFQTSGTRRYYLEIVRLSRTINMTEILVKPDEIQNYSVNRRWHVTSSVFDIQFWQKCRMRCWDPPVAVGPIRKKRFVFRISAATELIAGLASSIGI